MADASSLAQIQQQLGAMGGDDGAGAAEKQAAAEEQKEVCCGEKRDADGLNWRASTF